MSNETPHEPSSVPPIWSGKGGTGGTAPGAGGGGGGGGFGAPGAPGGDGMAIIGNAGPVSVTQTVVPEQLLGWLEQNAPELATHGRADPGPSFWRKFAGWLSESGKQIPAAVVGALVLSLTGQG